MTSQENLVVAKERLWENGQFYTHGTPLSKIQADAPGGQLQEGRVESHVRYGFLADKSDLEKARNPEAFSAKQHAADAEATIAELKQQLAELKSKGPSVGDHSTTGHDLLGDLKGVLPEAKSVDEVVAQIKALQEKNGLSESDSAALEDYRTHVGQLLPVDYPERNLLLSLGYYTVDQVAQTEDAALLAGKGMGDKKLEAIRKVTPFKAAGK